MALRQADEKFIRNLQIVDPLLDVRYSDYLSCWVIDRKAVVPETEIKFLISRVERARRWCQAAPQDEKKKQHFGGVFEELQSAKKNRRVIFFTRNLDRTTFDRLALGDIQRYGGYSRLADELEAQEKQEEERKKKMNAAEFEDVNREAFDQLNFIWRRKDARLMHGERNLKTLLHGR